MAFDAFVKIDTIEGESPDAKHGKEIQLLSFEFGAKQAGTHAMGGGGGAGKAHFEDMTFHHFVDKASPKLMLACATGQHIPKAVLTVRKAGGEQLDYMIVTLTDVLVTSVHEAGHTHSESSTIAGQTASSGQSQDLPTESFTLNFAKIQWVYKEQKTDGSLGGTVETGWDVKANKKV